MAPQAGLSHTVLGAPSMVHWDVLSSCLGNGAWGWRLHSLRCFFLNRSQCYRCVYGDAPVLQQSGHWSYGNMVRLSLLLPSLCIFPKCPLSLTTGKRDLVGCLCAPSAEEGQGIYAIYSVATRPCPDPLTLNPSVPFPLRSSPMGIRVRSGFQFPPLPFSIFSFAQFNLYNEGFGGAFLHINPGMVALSAFAKLIKKSVRLL